MSYLIIRRNQVQNLTAEHTCSGSSDIWSYTAVVTKTSSSSSSSRYWYCAWLQFWTSSMTDLIGLVCVVIWLVSLNINVSFSSYCVWSLYAVQLNCNQSVIIIVVMWLTSSYLTHDDSYDWVSYTDNIQFDSTEEFRLANILATMADWLKTTWVHMNTSGISMTLTIMLGSEWTNKWMNEWINEWMNEWMNHKLESQ